MEAAHLPQTILIVEDHADTREGLAQLLQLSGYTVLTAEDGQQGLTEASAHTPDLILTDIMMPVMDGLELVKRLRARAEFNDTPIIVISAYGALAVEAISAGAQDAISKPIAPHLLIQVIKSLLHQGQTAP